MASYGLRRKLLIVMGAVAVSSGQLRGVRVGPGFVSLGRFVLPGLFSVVIKAGVISAPMNGVVVVSGFSGSFLSAYGVGSV